MKIINRDNDRLLANNVQIANTFWLRLKGLLGRTSLNNNEGLLIEPCKMVHGLGMMFPVEVLYLDKNDQLIYWQVLHPFSIAPYRKDAVKVLELPLDTVQESGTKIGHQLIISRTQI